MKHLLQRTTAALFISLLAACGGGGDDDSPDQHYPRVDCQARPELCK